VAVAPNASRSAEPRTIDSRIAEPRTPAGPPRRWLLLACLAITALPYLAGLQGAFVYDDLAMIVRNPRVTGFSQFPEVLTSPMLDFLDPQTASRIGYWRPVAGIALILGYTLGSGAPLGFHVVSLCLHLAATAVVFRLARRMTGDRSVAFFGALLFGLHPTHVEGVTWISAINDPLFGLFSALALDAFVAWREGGSKGWAFGAALWLLPALLSKEMGAAVVPMAIAVDLGRRISRDREPLLRAYAPFAIAVAVYYLARTVVFGDLLAGFDRTTHDFGVPPLRLFQLRFELLGGFLWLLAWPRELNLFRPFRPEVPFGDPEFLRAIACILALCLLVRWAWKRRASLALACALLIPAAVSPALLRVESLGIFPLSDRFLYLGSLGFGVLIAATALRHLPRRVALAALWLLAAAYGLHAHARTAFWRDEETLFETAVEQSPESPYVRWGHSRVLLQEYRSSRDVQALAEAHAEAQAALDLLERAQGGDASIFGTSDDHVQSNLCLAQSLLAEAEIDDFHDYETACKVFEAVAARYPENAYAQSGLGVALTQLHRYDEAETAFRKAIALNPRFPEAHHNLGLLRLKRGDPAGAAAFFEEALAIRHDALDDLVWLARARAQAGDREAAIAAASRAHERHPRATAPLVVLGTLAAQKGALEEAMRRFQAALDLDPANGEALLQKSKVQLARGEKTGAQESLLRAAELLPESFEAHYNAGALLLQSQGLPAALPYLTRAYGLRPDDATGELLHQKLVEMSIEDVEVLSRLAATEAARGDVQGAIVWLDRALERRPDHGPSLYLKAMMLLKRGDPSSAEPLLRRACEAMPESFQAAEQLGRLLMQDSRGAEALPFLERALDLASRASRGVPGGEESLAGLRATVERLKREAR